ncbi:MAG: serine hydrolase domain-containing protein [Lysobacter sp.]
MRQVFPLAVLPLLCLVIAWSHASTAAKPTTQAQLRHIESSARERRSDAVLIVQDGKTLLETHSQQESGPIELMSATKSVVALAIGALMLDGKLASLDEPVRTFYPEWNQGRKRDITVRMLMNHTSGLQNAPNAGAEIEPAADVVQLALAAELDNAPGEKFAYNNKATNLLAGIVERASGEKLDVYLQRRLFAPLNIQAGPWHRDRAGNPTAMAGLPLTARDAAKLGQLLLDDGTAPNGTRLLPTGYVQTLFAESPRSPRVGLLWWRLPAWETYELRSTAVADLRARGVDAKLLDALAALAGRRFDGRDAIFEVLAATLGAQWNDLYGREIIQRGIALADIFDYRSGPIVAYYADGYLGQYIVVVPEQRLVAVRQIRRREDHRNPQDSYADFGRDVAVLATMLAPKATRADKSKP